MTLDNTGRFLFRLSILLATVSACICGALYYLYHCPCHASGDQKCKDAEGWLCSFLDNPEAIIGALVLVCNVVLFWYISKQVRQGNEAIALAKDANTAAKDAVIESRKANIQTTRTIDLSVNAERGKLEFWFGSRSPDNKHIHYRFRNVGKTSMRIDQWNVTFTVIARSDSYPAPVLSYSKVGVIDFPLDAGGVLSTWADTRHPKSPIANLDTEIEDQTNISKIGTTHVVFAQFRARYSTVFGIDYIFRTAIVYDGATTGASLNPIYEEDTPWMFRGTFPSTVLNLTPQ